MYLNVLVYKTVVCKVGVKMKNQIFMLPIKVFLSFSFLTFFLFCFGPYDYVDKNRVELVIFMLASSLFMYLGFKCGIRYKVVAFTPLYKSDNMTVGYKKIERIVDILFKITLVMAVPRFMIFTGAYLDGIIDVLYRVPYFFSSALDIYQYKQSLTNVTGIWKFINYLNVLLSPFFWAYMCLSLLFWERLKPIRKVFTFFIWTLYVLQYICTGTNVGIFDFVMTYTVIKCIKPLFFESKDTLNKSKMLIISAFSILFLIFIFDMVMSSRIGSNITRSGVFYTFNYDSFIYEWTPDFLKPVLVYITRYFSSPYVALSLAFEVPFESTYGVGYSWFIMRELGPFYSEIFNRTYNMQLESMFGYQHYANWHTMYLWFANDVSLIGVPFVLFILYWYFGNSWRDFVENKDIYAFLRVMIFVKMCFFVSANNQVFQNSDTTIAFWILVMFSLLGKKLRME